MDYCSANCRRAMEGGGNETKDILDYERRCPHPDIAPDEAQMLVKKLIRLHRQYPETFRLLTVAERASPDYPDWSLVPGLPLAVLKSKIDSNMAIDDYEA